MYVIIGPSLSKPYLVRCMAEVPVAMYVRMSVTVSSPGKYIDVPARYNFVCNSVHITLLTPR